jgi:hypothetical protein
MSPVPFTTLKDQASVGAKSNLLTGSAATRETQHGRWLGTGLSQATAGIAGNFPLDKAVVKGMPSQHNPILIEADLPQ